MRMSVLSHRLKGLRRKQRSQRRRPRQFRRPQAEVLEQRLLLSTLPESGQLPMIFEPNDGQTAPEVDFVSRAAGYATLLTSNKAVLSLRHRRWPKTTAVPLPPLSAWSWWEEIPRQSPMESNLLLGPVII